MKNLLTITLICFGLLTASSQNLDHGLQGYYKFNGDLSDHSPNDIEGTGFELMNTIGLDGGNSTAYLFNAESSYINLSTNSRNVTNQVSINVWFKTFAQKRQFIVSKYNSDDDKGFFIGVNEGNVFVGGRDGSGTFWQIDGSSTVNDGQWHHVIVVINKEEWSLYVDCSFENSLNTETQNPQLNSFDPLTIGNWFQGNGSGEHRFFSGIIDEFRIYNRDLSRDEVGLLCNKEYVTNIDNINKLELNVYPNPSVDGVFVNQPLMNSIKYNYKILNILGFELKSSNLESYISLESYKPGLYFLQIYEDDMFVKSIKISKE